MSDKAILVDRRVVPVTNWLEWARWMEEHKYKARLSTRKKYTTPEEDVTRVGFDKVGPVEVSTVFLGINHSFGYGPDLWFETMVFGGDLDHEQERYTTWDEAAKGHAKMVRRVTR